MRIWNGAFTAMIRSLAKVICDADPIMSGEFKKHVNGNWRGRWKILNDFQSCGLNI
jgi:hypothetical protein